MLPHYTELHRFQLFKAAAAELRYFAWGELLRSLVHKKNFWLAVTNRLHVRIPILSREVGYLFWV